MRAGRLRHRITIQENSVTRNDYGEAIPGWIDVATVWASVEAISGREVFAAQQTLAEADHLITIRYRSGLKPEMRAVFGNQVFDITAVLDRLGRRIFLELLCQEVIADAS